MSEEIPPIIAKEYAAQQATEKPKAIISSPKIGMRVIKASDRKPQPIKAVIYGQSGIGKTSLLRTLDVKKTLVLDMESGLLAVEDLPITAVPIRNWREAQDIAVIIGGADSSKADGSAYSKTHYASAVAAMKENSPDFHPKNFDTVFADSITVGSRLCMDWVRQQPQSYTKEGAFNGLKAYGLLKTEMLDWLRHLQHAMNHNIIFLGILDRKQGENGEILYTPQMEGGSVADGLLGIVDQVITMAEIQVKHNDNEAKKTRAFICQTINPKGYPAKDRSGALSIVEPADLGKLLEKIKTGARFNPDFSWGEYLNDDIIF